MLVALFLFSIIGVAAIGMLAWHADKKEVSHRKENRPVLIVR